jgi:hypothetical protein
MSIADEMGVIHKEDFQDLKNKLAGERAELLARIEADPELLSEIHAIKSRAFAKKARPENMRRDSSLCSKAGKIGAGKRWAGHVKQGRKSRKKGEE